MFEEKQDVTLGDPLSVDIGLSGIPGVYMTGDAYAPGVIPAGTEVSSFFVHFDTPNVDHQSMQVVIQTDADILGVILTDSLLDDSDPILGAPGTTYPTGLALRGTTSDPTEGNDKVVIGYPADNYARTLIITFDVENVLDQIRVITVVPEPSSAALAFVAMVALGGAVWRRRRTQR